MMAKGSNLEKVNARRSVLSVHKKWHSARAGLTIDHAVRDGFGVGF
jgi:hypothetical protein